VDNDSPVRLPADDLLRLPVRTNGVEIGRPVDLIVDPARNRALGFDVICRDESHRFLPLTAAVFDTEQIVVESPLVLLEEDQLDFYRTRAKSLRELAPVLEAVTVYADGTLEFVSHDAA
jgi:hypothetical protein